MKYELIGFRKGREGNTKLDGAQGVMSTLENMVRGIEDRNGESKHKEMQIKSYKKERKNDTY